MMAMHLHMQSHSLGSKLALLALHFPRLRIIWSRSLHATADIFRALKGNQDDPDPDVAAAIGKPICTVVIESIVPHSVVNAGECWSRGCRAFPIPEIFLWRPCP